MIYILRDGETDGPHDPGLVQAFLDTNEIGPDCLACIEGMKEWRAVGEVLVWARGKLLSELRDVVWEQVIKLKDCKINDAQARVNIRKALPKERTSEDSKAFDSFNIILKANADLLRNIEHVDNSPDELEVSPGWELYQICKPAFPRDWKSVWLNAGGKMSGKRMIARKDDPVWLRLSDFGYPFPPFSFEMGYWTDNVSRAECLKLGVIAKGDVPSPVMVDKKFDLIGIP